MIQFAFSADALLAAGITVFLSTVAAVWILLKLMVLNPIQGVKIDIRKLTTQVITVRVGHEARLDSLAERQQRTEQDVHDLRQARVRHPNPLTR